MINTPIQPAAFWSTMSSMPSQFTSTVPPPDRRARAGDRAGDDDGPVPVVHLTESTGLAGCVCPLNLVPPGMSTAAASPIVRPDTIRTRSNMLNSLLTLHISLTYHFEYEYGTKSLDLEWLKQGGRVAKVRYGLGHRRRPALGHADLPRPDAPGPERMHVGGQMRRRQRGERVAGHDLEVVVQKTVGVEIPLNPPVNSPVIRHGHDGAAAGSDQPDVPLDDVARVVEVLDDADAQHDIEARFGERRRTQILAAKICSQ